MRNSPLNHLVTSAAPTVVAKSSLSQQLRSGHLPQAVEQQEGVQGEINNIAAKIEYQSQPAYVAGSVLRKLFDGIYKYFSPDAKTEAQTNLNSSHKKADAESIKMTVAEFQDLVDAAKEQANGKVADLSHLRNVSLVGELREIYLWDVHSQREVFENLDVSGTNFLQTFNVDAKYFRNCNFSGSRFGNTTDLVLDGCDLTSCDMSNTTQRNLMLGADLPFMNRLMSFVDSPFNYEREARVAELQSLINQVQPTRFVNVATEGAVFDKVSDNYLTNYSQTKFLGVKINYDELINPAYYPNLMGNNLDLSGALYRLASGEYSQISEAIPAEEVFAESGYYVEAMLRNNVLKPVIGKKTTIAIASAINGDLGQISNKCIEVYGDENEFVPTNVSDLQGIVDLYNQEYSKKYNVEFVLDGFGKPYDYRIGFCQLANQSFWGQESTYSFLNKDIHIAAGYESVVDPNLLLHEFGHSIGSVHPFDTGIKPIKCSTYASVMCYENALSIMMPLEISAKPANLQLPQNIGPQDHIAAKFIFGVNPNYQAQDISTNVNIGQSNLIYGDVGYNNTASLSTASLPEGVKWIVLDAAKSIGTCYQFPCSEEDLAEGLSGNILVLYKETASERPEVLGSTLLFGGATNDFFVDGQKIEPVSPDFSFSLSPTLKPTLSPSLASEVPTLNPTGSPTLNPTAEVTSNPTSSLSPASEVPTLSPTAEPTLIPTVSPVPPTGFPTLVPSLNSKSPTLAPSVVVLNTVSPTSESSSEPTSEPSFYHHHSNRGQNSVNNIIYGAAASGAFLLVSAMIYRKIIRPRNLYVGAEEIDVTLEEGVQLNGVNSPDLKEDQLQQPSTTSPSTSPQNAVGRSSFAASSKLLVGPWFIGPSQ